MASFNLWSGLCCAVAAGPRHDELVIEDDDKKYDLKEEDEYLEDIASGTDQDLTSPGVSPSKVDHKKVHFEKDGSDSLSTRASSTSESDVSQQHSPLTKDRRRAVRSRDHDLKRSREKVTEFLEKNGFKSIDSKRKGLGGLFSTYPLHVAADQNDVKMVSFLLRSGADATLKDGRGRTASDCVKSKTSHAEVFNLLQSWQDKASCAGRRCSHWDAFFMQLESHPLAHRPGNSSP
mmetsp:Transcript_33369/g.76901  ORF Transcript_33369/g.76901 Transcript_33369/m.76901 type:complete len:234 (+) Transcript_33369:65-766(+)